MAEEKAEPVAAPAFEVPNIPPIPLGAGIVAAQALSKGENIDGICKAVRDAVAKDPELAVDVPGNTMPEAEGDASDDKEQRMLEYYQSRYLMAVLRREVGHIYDLSLDEMEDVAVLTTKPAVGFEEWLRRKGLLNERAAAETQD